MTGSRSGLFSLSFLLRAAVAALVFWFGAMVGNAHGEPPAVTAVVAGSPETVFDWSADACNRDDFPDAPARAFRNADGEVHLVATHHVNRLLVGPSLESVRPNCDVVFEAGHDSDLAAYDDRSWLVAPVTEDGETIYALVHSEYQGWHRRPERCEPGRWWEACWYNVITWAVSTDGGRSFRQPPPAERLVAALPYRHDPSARRRMGLFNPTGIVRHDGYYHALVRAVAYAAQPSGYCLIRTDRLDDPGSWRAWDGEAFTISFADPYRDDIADPAAHVCAVVAPDRLWTTVGSVTRHMPTGAFVAVVAGKRPPAPGQEPVSGVFVSASRDLVQWSWPSLVWPIPLWHDVACGLDRFSIGYPALLDPSSPSPSFDETDDDAYLYVTQFNLVDCRIRSDRDLVRVPLRISVTATDD